ncbi:unnamed protein product [Sphagnum jensenii]
MAFRPAPGVPSSSVPRRNALLSRPNFTFGKGPREVWHYALNPGLHSPQFQGVMLCYQGHRCDEGELERK